MVAMRSPKWSWLLLATAYAIGVENFGMFGELRASEIRCHFNRILGKIYRALYRRYE